jgi:hypothetical protein
MRPDSHPTELFKALQQRDWGAALQCLHRKPTEAKTWIYRETDFPQSQLLWKLLPLHAAIAIGAPAYLILELLQAYPDAAKKWDSKRSLPIHIAAARIDLDLDGERILYHLLRVFPESAGVKNGKGLTPIELAFGAQLRKDKHAKKQLLLGSENREPEEEGFELQLEMRDVIENYKSDGNEPSNWALIDASLSSSCSYESSSSSDENGINLQEIIPVVQPNSESESKSNSSSSTGSSSTSNTKSVAVQDVDIKYGAPSATSSISLQQSSDSSSTSHSGSLNNLGQAGVKSLSKSTSSNNEMKTAVEKDTIELTQNKSGESSRSFKVGTVAQAKSYDLPPRPSMYSSPVKSLPDPRALLKKRSKSIEKKSSTDSDRYSVREELNFESDYKALDQPTDLDEMSASSQLTKQTTVSQKDTQRERSFELPPKPSPTTIYSSPLKSIPSPIRAFKQRSRSLQRSVSLDCNSFEKDSRIKSRVTVNTNKNSRSIALEDTNTSCKQAHSFDCNPPKQYMYSSPVKSLPLPSPLKMFKSRSRSLQKKASLDSYSFGADTKTNYPIVKVPSSMNSQRKDEESSSLDDIIKSVSSVEKSSFATSSLDCIDTSLASNSIAMAPESVRSACSTCSVLTEAASPQSEKMSDSMRQLNLLEAVQEGEDNEQQVNKGAETTFEHDQVLYDFAEEAITNLGGESCNAKFVVHEMHAKGIITIEDLIKLKHQEFVVLFSDQKLALEMKRLLDEPEFENSVFPVLDSIDEESSSGSSSGIIQGLL